MAERRVEVLFEDRESLMQGLRRLTDGETAQPRTAPGAAQRLGPHYLKAVVAPSGMLAGAIIDCGDDAALVMKSLAAGWRRVAFAGSPALAGKLAAHAEQWQAALLHRAPRPPRIEKANP